MKKHINAFSCGSSAVCHFAYAEDGAAPVFDADNYPPQFDGQSDSVSVMMDQNVRHNTVIEYGPAFCVLTTNY